MVTTAKKFIGNGLYTVAEAALYARVSPSLMSRWLFGSVSSQSVIEPQFAPSDSERLVTFLDLVQTLAIREIRLQRKVPLPKFRQAIKVAKEHLGLDYPFARQHCTYLLGDELVIRPPGTVDEFIEVSGKHKGQRLIEFVEMYLEDLSFDPNGLVNAYRIFSSHHLHPIPVKMDPQKRFGEPLLPSGYTAMAIWEAIKTEGGIDRTAKVYGISKEEVETAYQFVDHLGKSAA
ncbi:hypothetical protein J8F10_01675 [Gemmata sp. G18]|uniref:DUF433 domain-containing protein n=1 Tax=Gemmata palustris TaxID=2822762 RepID=A0ABS5BJX6_9BACT|nr:hypothetical protein [Gemmata palustris]MBP3954007.1 hypothetical protein [Gemmata palustris]